MFELAPTDIRSLLGRASIDFADEDLKRDGRGLVGQKSQNRNREDAMAASPVEEAPRGHPRGQGASAAARVALGRLEGRQRLSVKA
jgi:hypothetical protein